MNSNLLVYLLGTLAGLVVGVYVRSVGLTVIWRTVW